MSLPSVPHVSLPVVLPVEGGTSSSELGVRPVGFPGLAGPFVAWSDISADVEGLTSSKWDPADLATLEAFFSMFNVTGDDVLAVLKHASSCSKSAAESIAAAAGDSATSSEYLRSAVDRNVLWLREADFDVAALGKRVRTTLEIPDLSNELPEPMCDEEERDFNLVRSFATSGVSLVFDKNYVATSVSGVYPVERQLFQRVRPAIISLLADLVKKGQAVVLPRAVTRALRGSNVIPIHWIPKVTNPLGRLIADASGGENPPNGVSCRDDAVAAFGTITLPRVSDVAHFLLEARGKYVDPVLSIDDITGAFSRLWLSSSSAAQSVMEVRLDDGFDAGIVLTSMFFGGSSCPHAWQAVSRTLRHLLARANIPCLMYVDDIVRVGERSKSAFEGEATKNIICRLLTPNTTIAWAADKANWGVTRAPFIGWEWRMDTYEIAMTPRAVVRFALRLLELSHRARASVRSLQGVASLSARFADVLPTLSPLSFIVYNRIAGHWTDIDALVDITPLVRIAISCWLAFLARAWNTGLGWARSLQRLVRPPAGFSVQFDGCLSGIGGVQPALHGPLHSSSLPAFAFSVRLPYLDMTSSQQNVTELLAVTFCIACAVRLGARASAVHLVGDSRTALSWVVKRVKSGQALRTYLLYHFLMEEAHLTIGTEMWLSSETNVVPDGLSRNRAVSSFPCLAGHSSDVLSKAWIEEALGFCNPLSDLPNSVEGFGSLFDTARTLALQLF